MNFFSRKIEKNLPRSERWFRDFWESQGLKHKRDQYNCPWGRVIPDLVNHHFKYVIEIDGSFHRKKSQKKIDMKKDLFYRMKKYQVIRIRAFDQGQLEAAIEVIERIRSLHE